MLNLTKEERMFNYGIQYALSCIRQNGLDNADTILRKHIESSKDFGDYNDFDRGIESVLDKGAQNAQLENTQRRTD